MNRFLKVVLVSVFMGLGIVIYLYPQGTKAYVDIRYKQLHGILCEDISKHLPINLIAEATPNKYCAVAIFFFAVGLFALLEFVVLHKLLAIPALVVIAGLHIPFAQRELKWEDFKMEVAKLVGVGIVFVFVLMYRGSAKANVEHSKHAGKKKNK
eukprot:TRINITY_DN7394_c0_g1_i1.p1 TRINITY_DN7394_c0_g1~~TRINITY_DN7394_c0_g1_i1.p1  ORF type:complete len:154 (-),score=19.41 TRINITY_DN7394_c0_g1_i1:136-597(-)